MTAAAGGDRPAARLDAIFAALADPIRRGIVERLARGACSVTGLGQPFAVTAPAISRHLRVLEGCGLIERWKSGRVHYCRLRTGPLRQAGDWIEQHRAFWEQQLDALERYLDREKATWVQPSPSRRPRRSNSGASSTRRPRSSSAPGRNRKR